MIEVLCPTHTLRPKIVPQQQLAALLVREVGRIQKTTDVPPKISIIDVVSAVTGLNGNDAASAFCRYI